VLIRRAEVGGRRCDVRVAGGRVTQVAARLARERGEPVVDARSGALLPGLADHHLHLLAMAAAARSADCSPRAVGDASGLAAALRQAVPDGQGWIRGVGLDERVAGPLDRDRLDALVPELALPVRLQHRSGALWILNSAAVGRLRLDDGAGIEGAERDERGRATGRLWRADRALRAALGSEPPDLAGTGAMLAAAGVTAVTDATPELGEHAVRLLSDARAAGALPQRVQLLGAPAGPLPGGLTAGPAKLLQPEHEPPDFAGLLAAIRDHHRTGRPVAVHCVTREAMVLTVAALGEAGVLPGDRIEHAALVPPELAARLAGVAVVTQPGFLADRGSAYRQALAPRELGDLYRYGSLLRAGIRVAPSSDAPFGPADPWLVLRAARDRCADDGQVIGAGERVSVRTALAGMLSPLRRPGGAPRRVRPGSAADLCLLHVPLAAALAEPDARAVRLVMIGGRRVAGEDGPGGAPC
jgi:predicted amidohydrolase YtcJ